MHHKCYIPVGSNSVAREALKRADISLETYSSIWLSDIFINMNLLFKTLALLCLTGFSAPVPQGFLGGLRNLFGGLAPRGRRPQSAPSRPSRPSRPSGGGGGSCSNSGPNHSFGGNQFLVSWRLGSASRF